MIGDNIRRIIILELTERDSSAFEDILFFLSRHPDIEKWELHDEPILSLPGLKINLAPQKNHKQWTRGVRETIGLVLLG
ncbi:MAG: hypothetical protein K2P28_12485, partial [Lachnospiraceae bacterium]|nr:hypothetical protein [Lachnospiraceae bacterium]